MVTFSQVQLDAWLAGALLPFIRILALFSAAPLLSHKSFPARARVALAAAIAFVVAPFANVPAGLTLASATATRIAVNIIPHTAQATTIASWKTGRRVNIEVDVLAKYVEKLLKEKP